MIDEYAVFKQGKMTVEVNWNEAVKPCEKIKFILNGKEAIIDRSELYQMMMIFGDPEQQEQLIPVTQTTVRPVKRMLKVKAKKDVKKGEIIQVVHTVYVPILKSEHIRLTPQENLELDKKRREDQAALESAGVVYKA